MKDKKIKLNKKGFTLVELLVVISIIGILSVVSLASFMRVQIKARDAQRKSDLDAVSKALMMYYNDYGTFPDTFDFDNIDVGFTGANEQVYMRVTPEDPKKDVWKGYIYRISLNKTSFNLFADLENRDDSQCLKESEGSDVGKWNDYCYGLSSPNTVVGAILP
jgi:prepilin-type N-terminal cleavage/methylation domain-containing protein